MGKKHARKSVKSHHSTADADADDVNEIEAGSRAEQGTMALPLGTGATRKRLKAEHIKVSPIIDRDILAHHSKE
jgi:hypothetical protein